MPVLTSVCNIFEMNKKRQKVIALQHEAKYAAEKAQTALIDFEVMTKKHLDFKKSISCNEKEITMQTEPKTNVVIINNNDIVKNKQKNCVLFILFIYGLSVITFVYFNRQQ